MSAPHIKDDNFQAEVIEASKEMPVVVDFWAEWCGPCKVSGPEVDKASGELEGKVKVTKMNVDENTVIPQQFGVMSIPTFIKFENGEETDRVTGFPGAEKFREWLG